MNLTTAQHYAMHIVAWLRPHCERIEMAGSIRRARPVCNDVDIVCIPKVHETRDMLGEIVDRVNLVHAHLLAERAAGKCRIDSGADSPGDLMILQLSKCQVDVFFAVDETLITRLICRTGSKEHNIAMAERAKQLGGHWNPSRGLDLGHGNIPLATEADFYTALNLPFIKPADREQQFVRHLLRTTPA